jgi:hypothetical protein
MFDYSNKSISALLAIGICAATAIMLRPLPAIAQSGKFTPVRSEGYITREEQQLRAERNLERRLREKEREKHERENSTNLFDKLWLEGLRQGTTTPRVIQ